MSSDYIYDGADIVTGPCTNMMGVPEEFTNANHTALGWEDAKVGGTFIKIGIGALRKPDDKPYSNYRLYDIVNGGKWSSHRKPPPPSSSPGSSPIPAPATATSMRSARLPSPSGPARTGAQHSLRNTGQRTIPTTSTTTTS